MWYVIENGIEWGPFSTRQALEEWVAIQCPDDYTIEEREYFPGYKIVLDNP